MAYVDVDDENFYKFINKKYAKYKIPNEKKTLKQICFPTKFQLQLPQLFLADFINPKTPYRGVLVYHKIGSGKTCNVIRIAESFRKELTKVIVALPASLDNNFRNELRSQCAGNNYLTEVERLTLSKVHPSDEAYKAIIRKSDERINKYYTIYSYDIFVKLLKQNKLNLDDSLLIVDEVHNMVSETGTRYEEFYNAVHSAENLRLVILTATPIYDQPQEIALTMNLLLPEDKQMPTGKDFINEYMDIKYTKNGPIYHVKNMDLFKEEIRGYISYFKGAPSYSYPRSELFFVKTRMSDKQYKLYKKIVSAESRITAVKDYVNEEISNSFFIGTRAVSNIVFPNNKIGMKGFESMTDDDYTITRMRELSPKFVKILRKIKKCEGTVLVYSNFKEYAGLKTFAKFLDHQHFKNYATDGPGVRRYGIWSGDEHKLYKEEVKAVFNNKNNVDGSQMKVVLLSPAAKEGISFLRVREIHLIDVYWNFSRMNQIIGRAIRFCSHKDVPYEKQLVDVYIYLATHPDIKISIDEYILKMALNKELINKQFESALKESAIDCSLFKNANVEVGTDILCET